MRIGELAREAGTTPRTVRYYEEIGLLPSAGARAAGAHREYGSADLERLLLILRLKDLLGLSLDELREVVRGEDARSARRREWHSTSDPAERHRILAEALAHTDSLVAQSDVGDCSRLVARRRDELETLERELLDRARADARERRSTRCYSFAPYADDVPAGPKGPQPEDEEARHPRLEVR